MPRHENPRLVVIGSVNVDHTVVADRFPTPGETISGLATVTSIGGKGANQAVAAARISVDTTFVCRVGDDAEGDRVLIHLAGEGVDVRASRDPEHPTGTAWITVADDDNQIIVVPGANGNWEPLDDLDPYLDAADVVLAQLEIPVAVVARAASRTAGTFILNAAPSYPIPVELLENVDILIVNDHELADMVGRPVVTSAEVHEAHVQLQARGAHTVITTRGPRPVVTTSANDHFETLTLADVKVIDTTGAGDAFAGVFAGRITAGESLHDAVAWGAAAGSLSVEAFTAQGSYPSRTQLTDALGLRQGAST